MRYITMNNFVKERIEELNKQESLLNALLSEIPEIVGTLCNPYDEALWYFPESEHAYEELDPDSKRKFDDVLHTAILKDFESRGVKHLDKIEGDVITTYDDGGHMIYTDYKLIDDKTILATASNKDSLPDVRMLREFYDLYIVEDASDAYKEKIYQMMVDARNRTDMDDSRELAIRSHNKDADALYDVEYIDMTGNGHIGYTHEIFKSVSKEVIEALTEEPDDGILIKEGPFKHTISFVADVCEDQDELNEFLLNIETLSNNAKNYGTICKFRGYMAPYGSGWGMLRIKRSNGQDTNTGYYNYYGEFVKYSR